MWKIAFFLILLWAALGSGKVFADQVQQTESCLISLSAYQLSATDFRMDNPASQANSGLFEAPTSGLLNLYVSRRSVKAPDMSGPALALQENHLLPPGPRRLRRPYQEACAISGSVHRAAQPVRAGPLS